MRKCRAKLRPYQMLTYSTPGGGGLQPQAPVVSPKASTTMIMMNCVPVWTQSLNVSPVDTCTTRPSPPTHFIASPRPLYPCSLTPPMYPFESVHHPTSTPTHAPPPAPVASLKGFGRLGGYTAQRGEILVYITRTRTRQSPSPAPDGSNLPSDLLLIAPRRITAQRYVESKRMRVSVTIRTLWRNPNRPEYPNATA